MFGDLLQISFSTDYQEVSFTVNPSEAGEYTLVEKVIQSDINEEIEANGGNVANLESVILEEVILEVITDGKNLDPLSSLQVFISAPSVPEVLIASANNIADGAESVVFTIPSQELKSFLEGDEYTVRMTGILVESISEEIAMKLKFRFKVTVG